MIDTFGNAIVYVRTYYFLTNGSLQNTCHITKENKNEWAMYDMCIFMSHISDMYGNTSRIFYDKT